jgi:hypothetical protein
VKVRFFYSIKHKLVLENNFFIHFAEPLLSFVISFIRKRYDTLDADKRSIENTALLDLNLLMFRDQRT